MDEINASETGYYGMMFLILSGLRAVEVTIELFSKKLTLRNIFTAYYCIGVVRRGNITAVLDQVT